MISVWDYDEEYIVTFPNGYGRSILTVPWVEIGGKCTIACAKTGYNATVDFHTKVNKNHAKSNLLGVLDSDVWLGALCDISLITTLTILPCGVFTVTETETDTQTYTKTDKNGLLVIV